MGPGLQSGSKGVHKAAQGHHTDYQKCSKTGLAPGGPPRAPGCQTSSQKEGQKGGQKGGPKEWPKGGAKRVAKRGKTKTQTATTTVGGRDRGRLARIRPQSSPFFHAEHAPLPRMLYFIGKSLVNDPLCCTLSLVPCAVPYPLPSSLYPVPSPLCCTLSPKLAHPRVRHPPSRPPFVNEHPQLHAVWEKQCSGC